MAQQTINIGASPNDGTGTPLRTAFQYTNSNFSELYTAVGPSGNNIVVPGNATITGAATVGTTLGVTGVSTFAAGTALLPALTTTGDTNTGIYYPAADTFAVTTGGSERYRVDSSGNVGIGVTPSAWGSAYKVLELGSNSGSWSTLSGISDYSLNAFYNASSQWIYKTTGTAVLYRQAGQHLWYNAPSGTAGNTIAFTQAMTLDASGRLLVGPTSANASGGVLQLSSGITFPAAQVASSDANTLDDYEEGTWTIGLAFGGASTGITTSTNTGRYTKVGRQVTVSGILALTNKGSSTGIAEITGLPFTIANGNEAYSAANVRFNFVSFADVPISIGAINSTKILLQEITNAGAVTDLTDADFTNTSQCIISFTYTV